tara:strand:- start:2252 stop:2629 length:378 start_codon:yes stop_codon:yes gene_type:complete
VFKYKSYLLITILLLFSGCNNKKEPTIKDLKDIGYKSIHCRNIDYYDTKADLGEDPFFKIYASLEIENQSLEALAARCFDKKHCIYELIESNEIVCQKYIVTSNEEFIKTWEEHEVLVFNIKKVM